MNSKRNAFRSERQQKKIDSGTVTERFPKVAGIVVRMEYRQPGIAQNMSRTVNFTPTSYAFFRVECLDKACVDGGFDLTSKITSMVRNRKETATGEITCEGDGPFENHSSIAYEITIDYKK